MDRLERLRKSVRDTGRFVDSMDKKGEREKKARVKAAEFKLQQATLALRRSHSRRPEDLAMLRENVATAKRELQKARSG